MVDYGKGIRLARVARGMTQGELGAKAGLTQNYISLLENHERTPGVLALGAIASSLAVPVWLIVLLGSSPEEAGPEAVQVAPIVLRLLTGPTITTG